MRRAIAAQFWVPLLMQLARVRLSWRQYLIVSSAMPLGIVLLLRLAGSVTTRDDAVQIITGNVVLAIAITAISMLAQRIAWMKAQRVFDYYATMPISRVLLLLAILTSFFIFALPGIAAILVVGALLYHVSLVLSWTLLPLIAGCGLALAGIGVAIGLAAPDEQLAGLFANLAMMAVLFLAIIPPDRLPQGITTIAWIIPSTYAVNAMRASLEGTLSWGTFGISLLALAAFSVAFLLLVRRQLAWRQE
jgi:ABC-2 type transport system permease protein